MITRLCIDNFRCFRHFELRLQGLQSVLLIGANGTGKSTIRKALELLRQIGRGANRASELIRHTDFARPRENEPIRFTLEAEIRGREYTYVLAFAWGGPNNVTVVSETLHSDGKGLILREAEIGGGIDRSFVALPVWQDSGDGVQNFRQWLARLLILAPSPSRISGESDGDTLEPSVELADLGNWYRGILHEQPAAMARVNEYLQELMPDFRALREIKTGSVSKALQMDFGTNGSTASVHFSNLSDGEKCFITGALVLAAIQAYGPLTCFWDEPDNYLALHEVAHFVTRMSTALGDGGQAIFTSHNPEAIHAFGDDNTLVLRRKSHADAPTVQTLDELSIQGSLSNALARGELA